MFTRRNGATKSDIHEMKSDIRELKSDIRELKGIIVDMKSDIVVMKSDIVAIKSDIVTMKNDIRMINNKVDRLDVSCEIRFTRIEGTLKTLEGFQRNESDAIEFELQKIVEKYLAKKYPQMQIKPYSMKCPKHPYTNKPLTDLDAAFLLAPLSHTIDYQRLKNVGITYIPRKEKPIGLTLVIAEAKHHINRERITNKLRQFNIICRMVWLARKITNNPNSAYDSSTMWNGRHVTPQFIRMIERSELRYITDFIFFFGAAYWGKGLLYEFENDVTAYKKLADAFDASTMENKKQEFLARASAIEQKWTGEKAVTIGAMRFVKFIHPSGERYSISELQGPVGTAHLAINGGFVVK